MPKVPGLGEVPKGSLFAGGLAVVGVGGYLLYKHMKNKTITPAPTTSGATSAGYGTAAGYGYGNTPAFGYGEYGYGGFGGGGLGGYPSPVAYGYGQGGGTATTNAQWSQNALTALTAQGLSGSSVLASLGKYLTGKPIAQGSADDTNVQAAIALEGDPPVAGAGGYPPAINYQGTQSQGGGVAAWVNGLHATSVRYDNFTVAWNPASGASSYNVNVSGPGGKEVHGVTATSYTATGLKQRTTYSVSVLAEPAGPHAQPDVISVTTH